MPPQSTDPGETMELGTECDHPTIFGEGLEKGAGLEMFRSMAHESRYELLGSLGAGGMGEVSLCTDRRLGRPVAVKAIRGKGASHCGAHTRFMREVQAQA